MINIIAALLIVILGLLIGLIIKSNRQNNTSETTDLLKSLQENLLESTSATERQLTDKLASTRVELQNSIRETNAQNNQQILTVSEHIQKQLADNRQELQKALQDNTVQNNQQLGTITDQVNKRLTAVSENLSENRQELQKALQNNTEQNNQQLGTITDQVNKRLTAVSEDLSKNREELQKNLQATTEQNNQQLNAINQQVREQLQQVQQQFDEKMTRMQESNEKKLTDIQVIVDEKLQKTLNDRLKESFTQVSNNLKNVEQGLGEMKRLATDVDSLQKTLTSVKTRGISGEMQLDRILSDMFTSAQYQQQVNIQGGNAVDFAISLPGKSDDQKVLLPIDSKFPMEDFQRLLDAESKEDQDLARQNLFKAIKLQAKNISDKYILVPKTTDFAIMFLPTEGLYLEVVNNFEFYESLQRDYKINVAGPSTMTAILNALQMGFKTLQIEKKSSEVYRILGAVKSEFDTYVGQLEKVQSKIQASDKEITKLIGTRTNVMQRKLSTITEISDNSNEVLGIKE